MDWAKKTARRDKKHLSFGIWPFGVPYRYIRVLMVHWRVKLFYRDHSCGDPVMSRCLFLKNLHGLLLKLVNIISFSTILMVCSKHWGLIIIYLWVRSRKWGCLVTWFCYQLIAKPGTSNKTATVLLPDPYNGQFFFVAQGARSSAGMICTMLLVPYDPYFVWKVLKHWGLNRT